MTWQTKIIAILLVVTSLFAWHKYEVNKAVIENTAMLNAKYEKNINELKLKSKETESKLYSQVSDMEYKKNAEIKTIDAKYRVAIDSLRQRQERSSSSNSTGNSSDAESTRQIDSERLFGRHAEISLGIARDAEELKTHLKACYAQYDIIYDQLNNYKSK